MIADYLFQFLTMLLGGTNIVTAVIVWQSRKSNAKITEADSLLKTGEVFTFLTNITKVQLAEMNTQIDKLKNVIGSQDLEIATLKKVQKEYELRCGDCIKPKK